MKMVSEPLAQLVEQQPLKLWVVGSNPTRLTILLHICCIDKNIE